MFVVLIKPGTSEKCWNRKCTAQSKDDTEARIDVYASFFETQQSQITHLFSAVFTLNITTSHWRKCKPWSHYADVQSRNDRVLFVVMPSYWSWNQQNTSIDEWLHLVKKKNPQKSFMLLYSRQQYHNYYDITTIKLESYDNNAKGFITARHLSNRQTETDEICLYDIKL